MRDGGELKPQKDGALTYLIRPELERCVLPAHGR